MWSRKVESSYTTAHQLDTSLSLLFPGVSIYKNVFFYFSVLLSRILHVNDKLESSFIVLYTYIEMLEEREG